MTGIFDRLYSPDVPPMRHQLECVREGWEHDGWAYLMEMGLGKSRTLIDDFCLNYADGRVDALAIVAEKGVYTNWTRESEEDPGELQKWLWRSVLPGCFTHTFRASRRSREGAKVAALLGRDAPGPRVLAINVEAISSTDAALSLLERFLRTHEVMLVVDESTLLKTHDSNRTKLMIKMARQAAKRRILTGSPITGSPSDAWPQYEFLYPGGSPLGHRSYHTFRARYCVLRDMQINGRTIRREVGQQNLEELGSLMKVHSSRRTKKECLDLPEKIYVRRDVEMTAEQERTYKELKRTAMAELRDGGQVTTNLVVTQMMRLHQVACGHVKTDDGRVLRLDSRRTDALLSVVRESGGLGEAPQAIVWCAYQADVFEVCRALRAEYGDDSVAEWHGGVRLEDREAGESDFQAGRRRFMVATKAGARGRTWTAATLVVYYSNDHDLEIRMQSEDRAHRIGQTLPVTYVDVVMKDTIDEKIIVALRSKMDVVTAILNDGPETWI